MERRGGRPQVNGYFVGFGLLCLMFWVGVAVTLFKWGIL
jgi:hypothetical protein